MLHEVLLGLNAAFPTNLVLQMILSTTPGKQRGVKTLPWAFSKVEVETRHAHDTRQNVRDVLREV